MPSENPGHLWRDKWATLSGRLSRSAGAFLPVLWCPLPYAKVDTGSFCSLTGHCTRFPPTDDNIIVQVMSPAACQRIWDNLRV